MILSTHGPRIVLGLLALCAWSLLSGCAGVRRVEWYRLAESAPPDVEAQWAKYHWYIADVRYSFMTRQTLQEAYRPISYADLHLVVKALTPEGSQIGTLNIPYWNQNLAGMEVVLLDSAGNRMPLDQERIKALYKERGVVVLPRVTRGCVVAVHIRQGPFQVLDYWEYPMHGAVPTWKSVFKFTYPKRMHYRFKGYNGVGDPFRTERARGSEITLTWQADRVLPVADIPFLDPMAARPRLVITSRNPLGQGHMDWASVADLRRRENFGRALAGHSPRVRAKALMIAPRDLPDTTRARLLLRWVHDNMGINRNSPTGSDLDEVLQAQQGNLWQVAALLREMFTASGLESDLVLSRERDLGGLDSIMITPNAAWEPFVIVTAGGREWTTSAHARAYGLGDYPSGFFGIPALSIESRTIRTLPDPPRAASLLDERHEIPMGAARERKLTLSFEGPLAGQARSEFLTVKWSDTAEYCRAVIRSLGFQASVRKCALDAMDAPERPLRLDLMVENEWTWVERAGARQMALPDLFSRPGWFYDSARTEPYHFPYDLVRRQTAVIPNPPGKILEVEIPCAPGDSPVLRVACPQSEGDSAYVFTREVTVRKGRFFAAEVSALNEAWKDLDRVREAKATIR